MEPQDESIELPAELGGFKTSYVMQVMSHYKEISE